MKRIKLNDGSSLLLDEQRSDDNLTHTKKSNSNVTLPKEQTKKGSTPVRQDELDAQPKKKSLQRRSGQRQRTINPWHTEEGWPRREPPEIQSPPNLSQRILRPSSISLASFASRFLSKVPVIFNATTDSVHSSVKTTSPANHLRISLYDSPRYPFSKDVTLDHQPLHTNLSRVFHRRDSRHILAHNEIPPSRSHRNHHQRYIHSPNQLSCPNTHHLSVNLANRNAKQPTSKQRPNTSVELTTLLLPEACRLRTM